MTLLLAALALAAGPARPQSPARTDAAPPLAARTGLPADFEAALAAARIPVQAAVVMVQDVTRTAPRVVWQPDLPVNPASLMKLLPTLAALEQLGPAYAWTTPVWCLTGRSSSRVRAIRASWPSASGS
jgi:D-alanyl-D-alanine carboxypeptidase